METDMETAVTECMEAAVSKYMEAAVTVQLNNVTEHSTHVSKPYPVLGYVRPNAKIFPWVGGGLLCPTDQ
jgi:hypothetical protein